MAQRSKHIACARPWFFGVPPESNLASSHKEVAENAFSSGPSVWRCIVNRLPGPRGLRILFGVTPARGAQQ